MSDLNTASTTIDSSIEDAAKSFTPLELFSPREQGGFFRQRMVGGPGPYTEQLIRINNESSEDAQYASMEQYMPQFYSQNAPPTYQQKGYALDTMHQHNPVRHQCHLPRLANVNRMQHSKIQDNHIALHPRRKAVSLPTPSIPEIFHQGSVGSQNGR